MNPVLYNVDKHRRYEIMKHMFKIQNRDTFRFKIAW